MESANRFPLDFDALHKGDKIGPAVIEEFSGATRGSKEYDWAVMGFRGRICRELRIRGIHWTVRQVGDELHILTDEEAVEYNARMAKSGRRRMKRAHHRLAHVDPSQLTEPQRSAHERSLRVLQAQLIAMQSARPIVLPGTHQRSTPGLPRDVS